MLMNSRESAFEEYYERVKHCLAFIDPKDALRKAFFAGCEFQVDSLVGELNASISKEDAEEDATQAVNSQTDTYAEYVGSQQGFN